MYHRLFYSFVNESPRWLISRKQYDKTEAIIYKAAKQNGNEANLPDNFMSELIKTEELVSEKHHLSLHSYYWRMWYID